MKDPATEILNVLASKTSNSLTFVESVFTQANIFSAELTELDDFIGCVADYLDQIITEGIKSAALTAQSRS